MIISRAPFRISFFGGGTDYPAYSSQHGGCVFGTTIDKYCYVSLRKLPPFFDHKHRIVHSLIENVKSFDEITHPAAREILKLSFITDGLELHHDGDLPARSGLGSSSSFTVALINAIGAYKGQLLGANHLAAEAIYLEQEVLRENVGSQDQIWAAHGGTRYIAFKKDGTHSVSPIPYVDGWNDKFMLFFTGISRIADTVAKKQIEAIPDNTEMLHEMKEIVQAGMNAYCQQETALFGHLLRETWHRKRSLAKEVSNDVVDNILHSAILSGAWGGKLLGAGGGGFVLLCAPEEAKPHIREALRGLTEVQFQINSDGAKIVVYERDV